MNVIVVVFSKLPVDSALESNSRMDAITQLFLAAATTATYHVWIRLQNYTHFFQTQWQTVQIEPQFRSPSYGGTSQNQWSKLRLGCDGQGIQFSAYSQAFKQSFSQSEQFSWAHRRYGDDRENNWKCKKKKNHDIFQITAYSVIELLLRCSPTVTGSGRW